MDASLIIIAVGFMLASYSVIANDSIQTLGTFLHSNAHRKWWMLWLYSSTIMVAVVLYGWANYNGDVSYDRLDKVYAKMVDFKSARQALKAVETSDIVTQDPSVGEWVQSIREGLKGAETVYLGDNTLLEQQLQTWSAEMQSLRDSTSRPDWNAQQQTLLAQASSATDAAIDDMLGHRDVRDFFKWYYVLPPIVLLLLTYFGFPVSTSFLILITFQPAVLGSMLLKSVSGYFLAFVVAIIVYLTVMRAVEKHWRLKDNAGISRWWVLAQWSSTAFLWSMWLIQDMANVFVYVPRPLPLVALVLCVCWMVAIQGFIFYTKGGKIQQIVTTKTNTHDIRSATIVDLIYGVVLYFFKIQSNVPMSTTWVFIGLLAGREFAFSLGYRKDGLTLRSAAKLMGRDAGKVIIGLLVSIALAYGLRIFG